MTSLPCLFSLSRRGSAQEDLRPPLRERSPVSDFETQIGLSGFAEADVDVCRPRLREILLAGGSARYFDGTNTRVLDAGRWVQPSVHKVPMSGIPGLVQPLLRLVSPKYVELEVYAGRQEIGQRPIWTHAYKSWEIGKAIREFLRGASPKLRVRMYRREFAAAGVQPTVSHEPTDAPNPPPAPRPAPEALAPSKGEQGVAVQTDVAKARSFRNRLAVAGIIGFFLIVWLIVTSQETTTSRQQDPPGVSSSSVEGPNQATVQPPAARAAESPQKAVVEVPQKAVPLQEQLLQAAKTGVYPPDLVQALREKAEVGDAFAQSWLGAAYYSGLGVPQSYEEAAKWCAKAADQGDAAAQDNLGMMCYSGLGVPKNSALAFALHCLAAKQGNTNAMRHRDLLLDSLSPEELVEGLRLAAGGSIAPAQPRVPDSQATAEIERVFYEKYPDLTQFRAVVNAVAATLQIREELSPDEAMDELARAAREVIRQSQARSSSR
jgi:hypothetical protein